MNILATLDDPKLFGPHFRGDTWAPWRAFLAALFALPMDDAALAIYHARTGRQDAPARAFSEAALVIGRRGGKSRVLALLGVYLACFRDYAPHLAPGEVATIGIIAADRRQARVIFRFVSGLLRATPLLAGMIAEETAETIKLKNRVQIEIGTASFRVTRGYTYAAVLCDETAFWRSDDSANPDTEIVAALRPGMATIPGSVLLLASSPYRKRGVLHAHYIKYFGRDDARVLVWQAPSLAMNPGLDAAIVAEAYADDPDAAAAEYGAEFRSDLSDFVPRSVIEAVTVPGRLELPPVSGVTYRAFVDPSGGTGADSMTLAIGHRQGDVAVLDAVRDVRPPFSPDGVTADFAALLRSYGVSRVTGDRYAGEWPRERFRVHGIVYEVADRPRSDLYRDALPLLNSGRCELLDVPRLAQQFTGLERRTGRGGRDSIDHPPGAHDDLANVAAGALLLVAGAARAAVPHRFVKLNYIER